MAISTYSELKSELKNWLRRSSLADADVANCISLAEARLNRKIKPVLTSATLTGTASSRAIDVSGNSVAEPIGLFLTTAGVGDKELTRRMDGTFPYSLVDGTPSVWGMEGANVVFDCPLSTAYTFRFKFKQRYALSDNATTNWLLTNHPDIYLAAAIVWGGLFVQDDARISTFATALEQGIPEVTNYIARQNLSTLRVDPALLTNNSYDFTTDT